MYWEDYFRFSTGVEEDIRVNIKIIPVMKKLICELKSIMRIKHRRKADISMRSLFSRNRQETVYPSGNLKKV